MSPTHSAGEAGCQTSAAQLHATGAVLVSVALKDQHEDQLAKQISLGQQRRVSEGENPTADNGNQDIVKVKTLQLWKSMNECAVQDSYLLSCHESLLPLTPGLRTPFA